MTPSLIAYSDNMECSPPIAMEDEKQVDVEYVEEESQY